MPQSLTEGLDSPEERPSRWTNPYKALLTAYPGRIIRFDEFTADADAVSALVSRYREVHVEIGSGSGGHMLGLAFRSPQAAVIGFELRFKRAVRTVQKAQAGNLENVFVLRTRGQQLAALFRPGSVDSIYVNFPEPWDRKRWTKHRLLNLSLLRQADAVLKPRGFISIKSDHRAYLAQFMEDVQEQDAFCVSYYTEDLYRDPQALEGNIQTEFEKLFVAKGMPISMLSLVRKQGGEAGRCSL